ncbi:MAG: hypothetical protein SCH71_14340 [Desulfobulbaceae bacterium]|nr:hypothetical protein [Desulfobulbaceae bacterium]
MDKTSVLQLLQTMIDYFEAGSREADRAAKNILQWDSENLPAWNAEIRYLMEEGEWTGLRAPEAEIIAAALRSLQQQLPEQ